MRPVIMLALASTVALSAPFAFAAEATGKIVSENPAAHTITLQGGQVFTLPNNFSDPAVKMNTEVRVVYEAMNGKNVASHVTAIQGDHKGAGAPAPKS